MCADGTRKHPAHRARSIDFNKLTAMPDASVLLCEGEKAADAAQRLFPDYACITWFGGTAQVEHADFSPLADRLVIAWPDADASGLNAMRKLISRLPADTQVVCTDGLPEAFDAADLEREGCSDPAAWLSERLRPTSYSHIWRSKDGDFPCTPTGEEWPHADGRIYARVSTPEGTEHFVPRDELISAQGGNGTARGDATEPTPAGDPTGLILPDRFSLNNCGLWYQPPLRNDGPEPDQVKVCDPFDILARTSDDTHHNHGLLLQWIDQDGEQHTWSMPRRMVHAEGNAIAAELEDAGLSCGTSRAAHDHLKHFFGAVRIERHVRCVDRAGWHGGAYVLPDGRVFGADADGLVMQTEHVARADAYAARGTLGVWRDNIACFAVGNDFLTLAISCAFAAPLLDVLGEPSGGVHLHGISQTGKTTLLRSAMSVIGPADDKHMRTWRATANGLEAVAAETSDGLLTLDEISQANGREVDQVVYMLANNTGKLRATRAGGARRQRNWLSLFLSTGEITLEVKLAEAGLRVRAGQDVRMIGLPADAGAGMGVWQNLHGFSSAAELAERLRAAASTYCGTAGPAYLDQLARERSGDPKELTATLRALCQRFLDAHVPSGADGQVRSVARRFALIGAAGELATAYDITGWPDDEALRAAGACFKRWLSARGGAGAAEDMQAVKLVRAFIAAHGASRFETLRVVAGSSEEGPDDRIVINRAGWKRQKDGEWEYLITTDTWNDVCASLDPGRVAAVLMKRGFLLGATERHKADSVRITGYPRRLRLYRIPAAILGDETDGE